MKILKGAALVILGMLIGAGIIVLKSNLIYLLKIWITLFIIGGIFYPITSRFFKGFNDRGWMFSKIIGIVITSLIVWWFAYIKIMKFSVFSIYFSLFVVLMIVAIVLKRNNKLKISELKNIPWKHIINTEIIFIIIFGFWGWVRSYLVTIDNGTEQFMDYGFMNKIMNTDYFPIEDIWFSGFNLNYYYYGQYVAAFINKAALIAPQPGYASVMSLLGALSTILPYSIVLNLGKKFYETKKDAEIENNSEKTKDLVKKGFKFNVKLKLVLPYIMAVIAGLSISIGGTLFYPIYNWILPQDENHEFSCWDAVRYIGYNPETNDKTITDIPTYSNVTKDLHAHYADIMFVFTIIAILMSYMFSKEKEKKYFSLYTIMFGLILGVQKMTNYWDFPIYLVVISLVIIFKTFFENKKIGECIGKILALILEVVIIEELVTIPFTRDLYISATKVLFTHVTSPLHKWLVLWGFQSFCVIVQLVYLLVVFIKQSKVKFFDRYRNLNIADIFGIVIGLCALGLAVMPEIIYLKDIYNDEYKRANTMFKLTYQAYIMFALSISFIIIKFTFEKKYKLRKFLSAIMVLIQLSTFSYGIASIKQQIQFYGSKARDFSKIEDWLEKYHFADFEAIQWIKENIEADKVILQIPTGSYIYAGSVSVFTGNPTVLAWHGHEWIWRATRDYQPCEEENERWNNINRLYFCENSQEIKNLAQKYNVEYIFIGESEYNNNLTEEKVNAILQAGEIVYNKFNEALKKYIYIVKVNN